ncbi:TonB-dependent receptor [Aquincola sp. MAHUQ-54]|uniref:TonB-dependent receptor n=1 Tax=Aquincola agrisoli TaxID=3119538 RepID=A0AAW9Q9C5_9BURK
MLKRTVLRSTAAGCMLATVAAWAQDGSQRVEVTGSAVRRIDAETALPVQILHRADIERSGATSLAELIQNLPAMQGHVNLSQSVGGGGGGYADASIHGIGGERTLVLLNGRRMAAWAGQNFTGFTAGTNLNTIPLAAVERVEILTDGASAIYGADAIAGVVNFILRKDLETGTASLNHSIPKGGAGRNTVLSATKGFGSLERDGHNTLLSISHERQQHLLAPERSFSRRGTIPFGQDGKRYVFFNGSVYGAPANYIIVDPETQGGVRFNAGNGYLNQNQACARGHVAVDGFCQFDFVPTIETLPEAEQTSLFGSFSKSLGGTKLLQFDAVYSELSVTSRIAPAPVGAQIPTGSALYDLYMPGGAQALDPTATYGDDLYAYWRGIDTGKRTVDDRTRTLHLSASLSGTAGAWEYTGALTRSQSRWTKEYLGGYLKQNELTAAVGSGALDPFLLPGQQGAAGNEALAGMQYLGTFAQGWSTLTSAELRGARPLFSLPGGRAQLGIGADFRRESIEYRPSEIAQGVTNAIAGDTAQDRPYDAARNVWGLYGELVLPVTRTLEFTAALRHDDYSDFGTTDNAKLAVRFQPSRQWLLRGSFSTGFRAPEPPQLAAGRQYFGKTGGAYNCPQAALAALKAVDPLVACAPDGSQYDVIAGGAKDLQPEKSRQLSVGLRFEPVAWASVGADLWHVRIKDRILELSESAVMADDAAYLKNFTVFVDPGTNRHLVALYLPNENLGEERYTGIDWDGRLTLDTPFGRLVNTLKWSHIFSYKYQRESGGAWHSSLGRYEDGKTTFRNLVRLSGTLYSGAWQNTLTLNYRSGYRDADCTADACGLVRELNPDGSLGDVVDMTGRRVSSYTTVDLQTRYAASKALTLTAGILNLFDRDPPLSLKIDGGHQIGYDNRYTDPRGRTLYLNAQYAF